MANEWEIWVQFPSLPLSSRVTTGKLLEFSVPQFPIQEVDMTLPFSKPLFDFIVSLKWDLFWEAYICCIA